MCAEEDDEKLQEDSGGRKNEKKETAFPYHIICEGSVMKVCVFPFACGEIKGHRR